MCERLTWITYCCNALLQFPNSPNRPPQVRLAGEVAGAYSDAFMTPETDSPETADIETSSHDYATRFAGPVGQWMLEVQERATLALLAPHATHPILDVGGGHGQLAAPLCRAGYAVTVLASSESCRHRIADIVASGACTFRVGNVIDLPFPDRAFPTTLSFRLLTHCGQWPKLIDELCRVAAQRVIIEYPTRRSLNAIAPLLFGAKKRIEGNTRHWCLFNDSEVLTAFARNGFIRERRIGQYVLPMVLHRALKCRGLSIALEGTCRLLGLADILGSPIIAAYVRKDSTRH